MGRQIGTDSSRKNLKKGDIVTLDDDDYLVRIKPKIYVIVKLIDKCAILKPIPTSSDSISFDPLEFFAEPIKSLKKK